MKKFAIVVILLIYSCSSNAQDAIKKWNYSIGINFTGVPAIQSRGFDTIYQNALSIAPAFTIRSHSGIGIIYSPAFIFYGSNSGIFMNKITAGFEQYDKKKFDIVAEYSHFFFTNNSTIPFTPISNEIIFAGTYKESVIRPKLYADIGFGIDKTISPSKTAYDVAVAAGISHSFEFKANNTTIDATPSLLLNAGTNEYFSFLKVSKYISHSKSFNTVIKNSHAKNNRGNGNNQTPNTTNEQKVSLNYIELNLESALEWNSFSLRPAGSLFLPTTSGLSIDGYREVTITYEF